MGNFINDHWQECVNPAIGQTVMFELSNPDEMFIGIVLKYFHGKILINIGNRIKYVSSGATFYKHK